LVKLLATTVKVAGQPTGTVWSCGCCVICGTGGTLVFKLQLNTMSPLAWLNPSTAM
jgi:hypothetical protein